MARRRSGGSGGLWSVVGGLVLIAIVPKEVWIAMGILAGLVGAVYVTMKILGENAKEAKRKRPDVDRHEPTLAELTATSENWSVGKHAAPKQTAAYAGAPDTTSTWANAREALGEKNRERSRGLRNKLPVIPERPPGSSEIRSALAVSTSAGPRERPSAAASSPSPAQSADEPRIEVPSAYWTREIRGQPEAWCRRRDEAQETNRQRAQYLREKFPESRVATQPPSALPAPPSTASSSGAIELALLDGVAAPSMPTDAPRIEVPSSYRTREFPGQTEAWHRQREEAKDANRQRAEHLRQKLPESRVSMQSPPVLPAPQPPAPAPRATASSSGAIEGALPVGVAAPPTLTDAPGIEVPSSYRSREFPGQSEAWHQQREEAKDANRRRAEFMRQKSPEIRVPLQPPSTPPERGPVIPVLPPSAPVPSAIERVSQPTRAAALPSAANPTIPVKPNRFLGDFTRLLRGNKVSEAFYAAPAPTASPPKAAHTLPKPPSNLTKARWFGPGERVEVSGLTICDGLLYVGPSLYAADGDEEPALIRPQLRVSAHADFRLSHTNYWPSYSEISPEARRAYLSWLAEGRSHPGCDIGLVFLFFYGLERRVIWDTPRDAAAKADWPAIEGELHRLLSIYGEQSNSLRRYVGELLSWMALGTAPEKLYEQPVPDLPRSYELAPYVRLALGQAAVDRHPLPAALALSWVKLSPETSLRTPATRCPDEFALLFKQRYREVLGPGLVLPKNRTKLKIVYQPASRGLSGQKIAMDVGQLPDVTALTVPIRTLREIAEQCTEELGAFSRAVGKDPGAAGSLEGLLLLPPSLWPPAMRARLNELLATMRDGRVALPLRDLLATLGGTSQPITRERVRALARALEAEQIGLEPHVLCGARTPAEGDTVVLFAQPLAEAATQQSAEFQTAALTLQLAAAVAVADGDFNEAEVAHLRQEIDGWAHLSPAERSRLHAHLQWLITSPPTLAGLRKKLEPLPLTARETVAAFMATLAQSDGFVSPDEVKFLEKIYKALGVESKRVFSDVHAASVGRGAAPSTKRVEKEGFRLDPARIAALQEDTKRVSALLSEIFTEEASPAPPALELQPNAEADSPLALDEPHTALLRLMLSRPSWSRAELEDAAADLELMLDGALEQVNETAFDAFDAPLCEGDDPIEINAEILEKLEA